MLQVDFHVHSLFSRCGVHTVLEILNHAKEIGMQGIAITDHGRELKSTVPSPFWDRFENPVQGLRMFKGIECNVKNEQGEIDVPMEYLSWIDVILVGLHMNLPAKLGKDKYTAIMAAALERNPFIDIITHPNDDNFPVDFDTIADCAAKHGMAIELNNSKNHLKRVSEESTIALLDACKKARCLIAINSDAHVLHEIGLDDSAQELIKKVKYPSELIINRDAQSAFDFIDKRKVLKKG